MNERMRIIYSIRMAAVPEIKNCRGKVGVMQKRKQWIAIREDGFGLI